MMRFYLVSSLFCDCLQAFGEIESGLDASLEEVFAREHDPFTVNDDLTLAVDKVQAASPIHMRWRKGLVEGVRSCGLRGSLVP